MRGGVTANGKVGSHIRCYPEGLQKELKRAIGARVGNKVTYGAHLFVQHSK